MRTHDAYRLWAAFAASSPITPHRREIPHHTDLFHYNTPQLLPMWLPVVELNKVRQGKILDVTLAGEPFIVYLDETTKPVARIQAVYGICPHQGAHLRKGTLDRKTGCVACPYHGFRFRQGDGVMLPTKEKISVPTPRVTMDKDLVYVLPTFDTFVAPPPYQPPEEFDRAFRAVSGSIRIHKNCDVITENVLDMLHVSYIHYFGNPEAPFPSQVSYRTLSDTSGRTTYQYQAGSKSISKVIGRARQIYLENEFHLPSTTITRVKVNEEMVKTILTRAMPINDEETILFYKVYRNFWCSNAVEEWVGDAIMRFAMAQTLAEDVGILKEVDTKKRLQGFSTIYDVTIDEYRRAKNKAFLDTQVVQPKTFSASEAETLGRMF